MLPRGPLADLRLRSGRLLFHVRRGHGPTPTPRRTAFSRTRSQAPPPRHQPARRTRRQPARRAERRSVPSRISRAAPTKAHEANPADAWSRCTLEPDDHAQTLLPDRSEHPGTLLLTADRPARARTARQAQPFTTPPDRPAHARSGQSGGYQAPSACAVPDASSGLSLHRRRARPPPSAPVLTRADRPDMGRPPLQADRPTARPS